MAILPTYRRQVLGTGIRPGSNASSSVSPQSPVGAALQGLSQDLNRVAGVAGQEVVDQAQKERERIENEAAMSAANMLSEGQVYWQQNFQERSQAWTPGAPDMREGINQDFDKWTSETAAKLPTEASKKYFMQHALGYKTRMLTGAYDYQQKTTSDALTAQTAVGIEADQKVVYGDPTQFQATRDRRVETIRARTDLTEAQKITAVQKYDQGLALASERGDLERDPAGWYEKRFGVPSATGTSGAGGGLAAYSTTFGNGKYVDGGDLTTKTLGQIEELGNRQIEATKGKIGKGDLGTSALGAYQFVNGTRASVARELYGKDWRNMTYTPQVQEAMAEKLFQDTKGGDLTQQWEGLKNIPGADKPGFFKDKSWSEMRGIISRVESSDTTRSAPLLAANDGTDVGPLTMPREQGAAGQPIASAPKTFGALDYEQQSALRQQALTKISQGDARYKAGVTQQMKDAQAMHKDGIVDPVPIPESSFARAFPEDGGRLYQEYQNSRAMASDIGAFKTMPAGDIARVLETTKPAPGDGYAAADTRQNLRLQAANQVMQLRNQDPAGFVTQNTPELKGLRARIDDPQTAPADRNALTQRYVTDSLAEQTRLGITAPKVLTPAQADAIGRQAMSATRPEDSANLVASLEQQYGKQHFPRVMDELVSAKKLVNEMLIIPNLPTPAARETVSRLARVKETDLTQGIDAKDQKTVKDLVTTNLEAMAATIPIMGDGPAATMNAYESMMRKSAYAFMAGGQSPSDAVKNAQAMLTGQYTFSKTMRLPSGVNESSAQSGAQNRLYDSLDNIDVPRDLVTGARNPEQQAEAWRGQVKANALWFTKADDSGVDLYAQGNNGVRYRVTKGGVPVSFSWSELQLPPKIAGVPTVTTGGAALVPPRGLPRRQP